MAEMMQVPTVKLQDPQLDIVPRVYYAKMGGGDITYNQYTAVSATNSQVTWSFTTPSVNVGVSRRFYMEMQIQVTYPATVLPANLPILGAVLQSTNMGCRQFPINNLIDSMNLRLNNASMNINAGDLIVALMRYGSSPDHRNKYLSGSPSFPDEIPSYLSAAAAGPGGYAGARNPFASYSTNVEEISRQPFNWLSSVTYDEADPLGVRSFTVTFFEPVFVSPINWTERDVMAFFGVQNIDLVLSLGSATKNRVFGGVWNNNDNTGANNAFLDAVVSVVSTTSAKPILHVLYLTPQITQSIPAVLHYPYSDVARYISNGAVLPSNTQATTGVHVGESTMMSNVNNITLHSIPQRIYIYARMQRSAYDSVITPLANPEPIFAGNVVPDIFARIKRISVNFNNRSGILASASEKDLYNISVKNGCDQSWTEWTTYSGSVLCIEPSSDLGIGALQAPSSAGNYQLQYQLTYENLFTDANVQFPDIAAGFYPFDIFTVVVSSGYLTINNTMISLNTGVLTELAVKDAPWAAPGAYNELSHLAGAGFFNDLWKGLKDIGGPVARVVGDIAGLIPHPLLQGVSGVAKGISGALGHGISGGVLSGGKKRVGRPKGSRGGASGDQLDGNQAGGYLSGGRRMGSASLSRRM